LRRFTLEVWNKLAELTTEQLDKGMEIQVATSQLFAATHPLQNLQSSLRFPV
jgi:hypothetical protein